MHVFEILAISITLNNILVTTVSAGCSGQHDLPIRINNPTTRILQGKKSFKAPDVNSLAHQLMLEIPTLTITYAKVLAEDAFNIEENMEITYRFIIAKGTAELNQFKISSTTLGNNQVNVEWHIMKAKATFVAQRNVKIQRNRRRRRWIGGGRRRCTWKKVPRGITKSDIQKIQGTLHSTMNRVSATKFSTVFVKERIINMQSKTSTNTCRAWKRVFTFSLVRGCSKRVSGLPKPFVRSVKNPKKIHNPYITSRGGLKVLEP